MRAPFQILALPYKKENGTLLFCVLHRADCDQWQFVAGGGEDNETPMEAAKREIFEECGLHAEDVMPLTSVCYLPANVIAERHRSHWASDTYVIPEYAFAFACEEEVMLSHEHVDFVWLPYERALEKLEWDSNKTALYELNCRLKHT